MRQISNPSVLNEAPSYGSSFSRGVRIPISRYRDLISISGTASIDKEGKSIKKNRFNYKNNNKISRKIRRTKMKTVKKDDKIKRVSDEGAALLVQEHGWDYCSKSEYKKTKPSTKE